jgi:hypothetical protein
MSVFDFLVGRLLEKREACGAFDHLAALKRAARSWGLTGKSKVG